MKKSISQQSKSRVVQSVVGPRKKNKIAPVMTDEQLKEGAIKKYRELVKIIDLKVRHQSLKLYLDTLLHGALKTQILICPYNGYYQPQKYSLVNTLLRIARNLTDERQITSLITRYCGYALCWREQNGKMVETPKKNLIGFQKLAYGISIQLFIAVESYLETEIPEELKDDINHKILYG